jgi:hypothetical protein
MATNILHFIRFIHSIFIAELQPEKKKKIRYYGMFQSFTIL